MRSSTSYTGNIVVPDEVTKEAEDLQVAEDLSKVSPPVKYASRGLRRPAPVPGPPTQDNPIPEKGRYAYNYPTNSPDEKLWRLPKSEVPNWAQARRRWNRWAERMCVRQLVEYFEDARYFVFRYLP